MATLALGSVPARRSLPRENLWAFALIGLLATIIRLPHFGDPAFMIDEQFYLLVGDRMLHGALPYVDIWDRKPIGLFLIYAGIRLLGGEGFWQYHIVATLFASGTAYLIFRIARPRAGYGAALTAGALYLLWIELAEGGGGQAPVFYNLFVAGAGLAVLRAGTTTRPRAFARLSFLAMLLIGLAIQVKYTVAAEGLCFGLLLSGWTLARFRARQAVPRILALALTALAPTLAVLAFYAAIGQGQAFWFANFQSIFLRAPTDVADMHYRTEMMLLRLLPFVACIAIALFHIRKDRSAACAQWRLVMLVWSAASLVGLFGIGTLYSHYILPVFVPMAAAAAPAFARWPSGPVAAIFLALLPAQSLHWPDFARTRRHQIEIANIARLIPADVDRGCLQMFDGPPVLAYLSHGCALSRFVFPDHLSAALEARAIGVDPVVELRNVLNRHPLAITIGESDVRPPNKRTFSLMRSALAKDYRLAGRAPFDGRDIDVFVRR